MAICAIESTLVECRIKCGEIRQHRHIQLKTRPIASRAAVIHHGRTLQNRDIIRMFEGLVVSDSFLLKSNIREMLLRRR